MREKNCITLGKKLLEKKFGVYTLRKEICENFKFYTLYYASLLKKMCFIKRQVLHFAEKKLPRKVEFYTLATTKKKLRKNQGLHFWRKQCEKI